MEEGEEKGEWDPEPCVARAPPRESVTKRRKEGKTRRGREEDRERKEGWSSLFFYNIAVIIIVLPRLP